MTDWTEWVRCDHCSGSGLNPRRYDNTACPHCRGLGEFGCECPRSCQVHPVRKPRRAPVSPVTYGGAR